MLKESVLCMKMLQILSTSSNEMEDGGKYWFGDAANPARAGRMFCFDVSREQNNGLQRSNDSIVRKWGFGITYDENLGIFVPVTKVTGKPVQCCLCRSHSTRRGFCQHELSCRPNSLNELVVENDPYESNFRSIDGHQPGMDKRTDDLSETCYAKEQFEEKSGSEPEKWFANTRWR